jgi:hypothetical protein
VERGAGILYVCIVSISCRDRTAQSDCCYIKIPRALAMKSRDLLL